MMMSSGRGRYAGQRVLSINLDLTVRLGAFRSFGITTAPRVVSSHFRKVKTLT
jgi:hypothetical protein